MNASTPVPAGFFRRSLRRIRLTFLIFVIGMIAGIIGLLASQHLFQLHFFGKGDIGRITLIHENADLDRDGKTIKIKKAFVVRESDKEMFILTESRIGSQTMSRLHEGDAVVGLNYRMVVKAASDDAIAGVASPDNPLAPALPDETYFGVGEKKALKDMKRKL